MRDPRPEQAVAELRELATAAQDLQDTFSRMQSGMPGPDEHFEGIDDAETARVTITGEGRVLEVQIADDWAEQLEPEQLGPSVLTAFRAATQQVIDEVNAAWQDDEAPARRSRRRAPSADAAPPAPPRVSPVTPDNLQQKAAESAETWQVVEKVLDTLDQRPIHQPPAPTATYAGRDRGGKVTVQMTRNGHLHDVGCDRTWLRNAGPRSIERTILEATSAARAARDAALAEAQQGQGDLAAMAEMLRSLR